MIKSFPSNRGDLAVRSSILRFFVGAQTLETIKCVAESVISGIRSRPIDGLNQAPSLLHTTYGQRISSTPLEVNLSL
jgi:hypothetical protein